MDALNALGRGNLGENLGIKFIDIGSDYLMAEMPVDHRTKQPMGLLHGGASVALAETLGSVASTLCLTDMTIEMAVGVEINANHLRPATSGFVIGRVEAINVGRKIHVWEIKIRDVQNKLICVSRITIAIVKRK